MICQDLNDSERRRVTAPIAGGGEARLVLLFYGKGAFPGPRYGLWAVPSRQPVECPTIAGGVPVYSVCNGPQLLLPLGGGPGGLFRFQPVVGWRRECA